MREILFRGKMKYLNLPHKKGDWVYGNYVEFNDGDRTIHCIYGYGDVILETVGQYTGLTDKNGVKIFEGDIVRNSCNRGNPYSAEYYSPVTDIGTVYYCGTQFWVDCGKNCNGNDLIDCLVFDEYLEVIGNIYDNPELLSMERNDENGR